MSKLSRLKSNTKKNMDRITYSFINQPELFRTYLLDYSSEEILLIKGVTFDDHILK